MLDNNQDDFEYNDGLGDLLREKEKHEFSWSKTLIVMVVIIIVCFFAVKVIYDLINPVFINNSTISQNNSMDTTNENDIISDISTTTDENTEETEMNLNPQDDDTIINDIGTFRKEEPATKKIISSKAAYKVITGTFQSRKNALKKAESLANKKIYTYIWEKNIKNKKFYLLQAGAYNTFKQAQAYVKQLKSQGIEAYAIKK